MYPIHPRFRRYNAFRWLRDSDFGYGLGHLHGHFGTEGIPEADLETVMWGLVAYAEYSERYPKWTSTPGVLDMGDPPLDMSDTMMLPGMFRPATALGVHLILGLLFMQSAVCFGIWVRRLLREKRERLALEAAE